MEPPENANPIAEALCFTKYWFRNTGMSVTTMPKPSPRKKKMFFELEQLKINYIVENHEVPANPNRLGQLHIQIRKFSNY